jgi:hypothetical protein
MGEELSKWQQYKQALGETRPWDFIKPSTEFVSKVDAAKRLDICKACPKIINPTLQCDICKCFMGAKVHLEKATCPIGKW